MKYIPTKPAQLRKAITFYSASLNFCQKQRDPDADLVNFLLHKLEICHNCLMASKSQWTKNQEVIFNK